MGVGTYVVDEPMQIRPKRNRKPSGAHNTSMEASCRTSAPSHSQVEIKIGIDY